MFLAEMEVIFLQLGVGAIFGLICALIANGRGRSPVGWFFGGMFGGCIGLIILLAISDLKKERLERERRDAETRRLREQLRADRQLGDQRHEEVHRRIGVHDKALGVDTAPPPPSALPPAATATSAAFAEAAWFVDVGGGERRGPLAFADVRVEWAGRRVGPDTFVWCDGMKEWLRVRDIPGMAHELGA